MKERLDSIISDFLHGKAGIRERMVGIDEKSVFVAEVDEVANYRSQLLG